MPSESLEVLGWNDQLEKSFAAFRAQGFHAGRVAVEDKHHYVVFAPRGPFLSQVTGKFLHESINRAELPKVGDWVVFAIVEKEASKALIRHVLPRRTKLSRKVAGRQNEEQVLVTNVDIAFIVQAVDVSFNPALLQRHLATAIESGVKPVVVLNKADLCDDVLEKLATVEHFAGDTPVIAVSAKTGRAMDSLRQLVRPGETIVFLGPSGVGKSSLINQLCGDDVQATAEVRESDAKGRHTTTWRELIALPGGGLVIDTPGMREFHMWLAGETGREAFADVEELAVRCHFRSCGHTVEKRCAVLEAVAKGELAQERYESYLKLKRELEFLAKATREKSSSREQRRRQAGKRTNDSRRSPGSDRE
jgi:ribosome biogenesis GTPase